MSNTLKRVAFGGVLAAAGIAAAAPNASAAGCTFDPSNARILRVQMVTNQIIVQNVNGTVVIGEPGGPGFACVKRANIDRVQIRSANPAGHDKIILDEAPGKFNGLDVSLLTGTGMDDLVINGGPQSDTYAVSLNTGPVVDMDGTGADNEVNGAAPMTITLNGNGGRDTLFGARSGFNFGTGISASILPLRLNGGPDNDFIVAGRSGKDIIDAGSGNDFVRTDQGVPGDQAFGGADADHILADSTDKVSGFETGGIGEAAPGKIKAKAGRTETVKVDWAHPVAWSKLRQVKLTATLKGKQVGSVAVATKSGKAKAAGGLQLVSASPVAHKGKHVTMTLKVKLADNLDGKQVDLRIKPKG